MQTSFSSIDEYIQSFDKKTQQQLEELRGVIRDAAPRDAKETINYAMPTYRWHGNLIHFAKFKNHIGIYPGPAAIAALADKLSSFKTTKGAIQIPLDQKLPKELITEIVHFNTDQLKDKQGPVWDSHRDKWIDCEEFMNQLILQTELKKEFKWGTDIYTLNGKNVIGWAGFKNFFSLWFYNGVFLEDRDNVLVTASEGKTKALRQWRFKSVQEMDSQKILSYIDESIQTIIDGKEIKIERTPAQPPEGFLKEALEQDRVLKQAFDNLTPGKQKDYTAYINEAKQEKTKQTRMEKITPLILEGKGLHDKYKR